MPLLNSVGVHYAIAKDISEVYSTAKVSSEHSKV